MPSPVAYSHGRHFESVLRRSQLDCCHYPTGTALHPFLLRFDDNIRSTRPRCPVLSATQTRAGKALSSLPSHPSAFIRPGLQGRLRMYLSLCTVTKTNKRRTILELARTFSVQSHFWSVLTSGAWSCMSLYNLRIIPCAELTFSQNMGESVLVKPESFPKGFSIKDQGKGHR